MKKIVMLLTIVFWVLFLIIDVNYGRVMSDAVKMKNGTYGELMGPLSFFRPIFLYGSFLLTLLLVVIDYYQK